MPPLRQAASVCLLHRASRSILMGKRLVGPWPGYWAFPGGGLDPGENHLQAALRELREETGIVMATREPLLTTDVRVSSGERNYAIRNFVLEVFEQTAAATSEELEPRWVEVAAAPAVGPIAHGTMAVVKRVVEFLDEGSDLR